MNQAQYRLLNVGEKTQPGDEYYQSGKWSSDTASSSFELKDCHIPHRRPMAPPEWIPIKDRAPEFPCVLGQWDDEEWIVRDCPGGQCDHWWTHWYPIPPPPAPAENEDQKALEACMNMVNEKYGKGSLAIGRDIFLAGVQHGRKGAK